MSAMAPNRPIKRFSPAKFRAAISGEPVAAVALAAGVTTRTIDNWAAGRTEPPASKLAAVAAHVGRPLDFFFERAA